MIFFTINNIFNVSLSNIKGYGSLKFKISIVSWGSCMKFKVTVNGWNYGILKRSKSLCNG